MDHEYVIYIDEAGDDGFGKLAAGKTGQSSWFAVGACIVRRSNDLDVVKWRDEIARAFSNRQRRDLHFKDLKHEQRRHACRVMATKPLGLAAVLSNKRTLLTLPDERLSVFKRKNHLHNYLTRYLLERASLAIKHRAARSRSADCRAKVIFSRRGGMNYDDFRDYLRLMKEGKEVLPSSGSISWEVIDPERIEALDHESRAGLQLADVSTSAIFKGVEPNVFGICEQSYADDLRSRIIRRPMQTGEMGSAFGFGVTHVPTYGPASPLTAEQRSFFESWK